MDYSITETETAYRAYAYDLKVAQVRMPSGDTVRREILDHVGAVVAVPLNDAGQVALVRQYRVCTGEYLWEAPAGLRDQPGEDPLATARRELAEETDLRAARWDELGAFYTSPGMTDERIHHYLARDLTLVPHGERHARKDEEADMELRWWDLDKALEAVAAGEIRNGVTALALQLTYGHLLSSK
ncbi:NUDIX domain-containing protein [Salininema proteolyticum]|uniref:NUDIX domain-containing protein n=1 Tax=Salininema proteolyticum TaxID=1607685 RepID=A0ABV8U0H9_9ACTN